MVYLTALILVIHEFCAKKYSLIEWQKHSESFKFQPRMCPRAIRLPKQFLERMILEQEGLT